MIATTLENQTAEPAPSLALEEPDAPAARSRWSRCSSPFRWAVAGLGWCFGLGSLLVGLSILVAIPVVQLVTMGYLLEASGRVARTGRLRDGLHGVRRAGEVGRLVAGIGLALVPLWVTRSLAVSAAIVDPGGLSASRWRVALAVVAVLSFLHVLAACLRGGRLRHFLWPVGHPFWLVRRVRQGGLYAEARDGLWDYLASFRLGGRFRLGLVGFLGSVVWLAPPSLLIAASRRWPLLGILGALWLAVVVSFLPFLQAHCSVEGTWSSMFDHRAARARFKRAPWAFSFALIVLLLASIPLYLLKIELVPREAAWVPSLVFVAMLGPARILVGWAYHRSGRREQPRHILFRLLGRFAIVPVTLLYVLVVFAAQYTSWGGTMSLFEQHAFLLPVPFVTSR